mgnify:CR=1
LAEYKLSEVQFIFVKDLYMFIFEYGFNFDERFWYFNFYELAVPIELAYNGYTYFHIRDFLELNCLEDVFE